MCAYRLNIIILFALLMFIKFASSNGILDTVDVSTVEEQYICSTPIANLAGYVTGRPLRNGATGCVTGRPDDQPTVLASPMRNRTPSHHHCINEDNPCCGFAGEYCRILPQWLLV